MRINDITYRIIGAAYRVHRELGPGLLESAYQRCLAIEMAEEGLRFLEERHLPLHYRGEKAGKAYRADFLVEDQVIVEVKAVDRLEEIHKAQLITYVKVARCSAGLILNFNHTNMQRGVHRFVYGYQEEEVDERRGGRDHSPQITQIRADYAD